MVWDGKGEAYRAGSESVNEGDECSVSRYSGDVNEARALKHICSHAQTRAQAS